MVKLALYKGKGSFANAMIRWRNDSIYSHCELIVDNVCYSSSVSDKGVRAKLIKLDPDNWDIIELPWLPAARVLDYYEKTKGRPYGWVDLFQTQIVGRTTGDNTGDFCSEWCAAAMGLYNPQTFSPASLGEICLWRTTT